MPRKYNEKTKTITFVTGHFSKNAIVYNSIRFNNVAASAWYNKAVSFVAARNITAGTGNGNFSPNAPLTRGQLIVLLMKALNVEPDEEAQDNFSDAGEQHFD